MKNIIQYRNKRSALDGLHPLLKLLLLVIMTITLFIFTHPTTFLVALAGLFLVSFFSHYNPLKTLRQLKFLILFLAIMPLFHSALFPGKALFSFISINFSSEGLVFGLVVVMRLLMLFVAFTLFSVTTSPKKLTQALTQNRVSTIRKVGFIISFTLNLIPTIFRDLDKIKDAQTSRGADFDQRNLGLLARIRNSKRLFQDHLSLIIPLLVVSLSRAEKQTIAIECRGFNLERRTFLHELKVRGSDMMLFTFFLALMILAMVLDKSVFTILL